MILKHRLDYSDLQYPADDGRRYELVRGMLLVTASSTPRHQRISSRLARRLDDYFERRGLGELFHAPIDLILTDEDVFVPDLLIVGDPSHVTERGIEGPPLLVVEILSPSTEGRDRGIKAQRYAELGVAHYWIVDPGTTRVECFRLAGEGFGLVIAAQNDEVLAHPDWDGFALPLGELWR